MSLKASGVVTSNESAFLLQALRLGHRCDGRDLHEMRRVRWAFTRADDRCTVELELGRTRVFVVVTAEVVPPYPDRPTDGFLNFGVELSPMASVAFEAGRPSTQAVELGRILERSLRDSRALDTEALCIVAGQKVWSIKCTIHALDHGGNLVDAAGLALIAALQHFRIPDVTVTGDKVTIHSPDEREPMPLSLHHAPVCVTFAFFDGGALAAIDPTHQEEEVMEGRATFALNAHRELVAVHKIGGAPLSQDVLMRCTRIAADKAVYMSELLRVALEDADAAATASRMASLRGTNFAALSLTTPAHGANQVSSQGASVALEDPDYALLHVAARLPGADDSVQGRAQEPSCGDNAGAAQPGALLLAMQRVAENMEASYGLPGVAAGGSEAAGSSRAVVCDEDEAMLPVDRTGAAPAPKPAPKANDARADAGAATDAATAVPRGDCSDLSQALKKKKKAKKAKKGT